jgi:predicted adenylyl cyclase CyaB
MRPGQACGTPGPTDEDASPDGSDDMPRNIEIKTRIPDLNALLPRARELAGGAEPQRIDQDDTFFHAAHGRLKLRVFEDGSGELLHYDRSDVAGTRASDWVRAPVPDPDAMREALARAFGITGRVRKTRWLLLVGPTRIHLDAVEGLGEFIELEVVLHDGQPDAEGERIADELMAALGLAGAPRIAGAYLDLLAAAG